MIVACAALVIALSGTGVAAVSQVVPRGSVGTPQLKINAVTSAKVKNGTLRTGDFAAGQVPVGPPGPKGDKGDPGDKGDRGPAGPSDGYSARVDGPLNVPAGTQTTVASLTISQPGKYVIWAKSNFSGGTTVGCDLRAESDADISYVSGTGDKVLTAHTVHEYTAAGKADLVCTPTAAATAFRARMVAIRVANLTVQP
jgi:hypothetical protein